MFIQWTYLIMNIYKIKKWCHIVFEVHLWPHPVTSSLQRSSLCWPLKQQVKITSFFFLYQKSQCEVFNSYRRLLSVLWSIHLLRHDSLCILSGFWVSIGHTGLGLVIFLVDWYLSSFLFFTIVTHSPKDFKKKIA